MHKTDSKKPPKEDKHQWKRPSLTYLGSIADYVHGTGKSPGGSETDPIIGPAKPRG